MRLLLASAAAVGAVLRHPGRRSDPRHRPPQARRRRRPDRDAVVRRDRRCCRLRLAAMGGRRGRAADAGDGRSHRLHGGDGRDRGSGRARAVAAAHRIGAQPDADDAVAAGRPTTSEPTAAEAFGWLSTGIATGTGAVAASRVRSSSTEKSPARRSPSRPSPRRRPPYWLTSSVVKVAIASAAAPSSRPTKPIPSPRWRHAHVLGRDPDRVRQHLADLVISGASLGRPSITVASPCTTDSPCSPTRPTVARNSSIESASR